MIKLSIIIPHYNSPDFLKIMLDSIPRKEEIEIIVVDDRSDKDIEKYEKLKSDYSCVRFFVNDGVKSAGTARNIGVEKSTSEWILFADADDYFTENFYGIVSEYFSSGYDAVYFKPLQFDVSEDRFITAYGEKYFDEYFKIHSERSYYWLKYAWFCPWSKLIRKKFVVENDIRCDELICSNDVMFSVKVGHFCSSFVVSEKNIYCYCVRKNGGSLTQTFSRALFDARFRVHIEYDKFMKSNASEIYKRFLFDSIGNKYWVQIVIDSLGVKTALEYHKLLRDNEVEVFENEKQMLEFFVS